MATKVSQSLSKEQIEAIVAERYIDSDDFVWNNGVLEFNATGEKNIQYQFDVVALMKIISELKEQIHEMHLRLDEAHLLHRLVVAEISHG